MNNKQEKVCLLQKNIKNLDNYNYYIIRYTNEGNASAVYCFEGVARLDTFKAYQQVKRVFKDDPYYLSVLFPSKSVLKSFNDENPELEYVIASSSNHKHPKMILLELFNSFKTNKKSCYFYYTL